MHHSHFNAPRTFPVLNPCKDVGGGSGPPYAQAQPTTYRKMFSNFSCLPNRGSHFFPLMFSKQQGITALAVINTASATVSTQRWTWNTQKDAIGCTQMPHDFLWGARASADTGTWGQTDSIDAEGQCGSLPPPRLAETGLKRSARREIGLFPWKNPLCLTNTDHALERHTCCPFFRGHSGPRWSRPSECWAQQVVEFLGRAERWGSVWWDKAGNRQAFPSSVREKADTGHQMCHPPGWEVTRAVVRVGTNKTGQDKPSLHL